jgi:hypothetical protein
MVVALEAALQEMEIRSFDPAASHACITLAAELVTTLTLLGGGDPALFDDT